MVKKGRKVENEFKKERVNFPISILAFFLKDKGSDKEFQTNKGTSKDQSRSYSQSGFSALESPSEKEMVILGSLTIGIRILLMTLQVQLQEELLHGMARDILHGWRQFLSICQTTPNTLFWILVVPDQLDQEQQLEDSRNMRCIMALP